MRVNLSEGSPVTWYSVALTNVQEVAGSNLNVGMVLST